MSFKRIHKSKSQSPQTSSSASRFAPHQFPIQKPKRPPTQEDIENKAFNQNKFEAFGLQLKEKYGTITPMEQEKLGVLQAKMDSFWVQRRERAKAQPNLLEIVIRNSQATQATEPVVTVQPKLSIGQTNDQYEQEADRVVEQVISTTPSATSKIQRQAEENQEEVQTKPLVEVITPVVQLQEALADKDQVQAKCEACEDEEEVQRSPNGVSQVQALHIEMANYVVQRFPGDGMVPPGDCNWATYTLLRGSVETAKAVVSSLGACSAGDSCLFLATKIAAITAEIAARLALDTTCFKGGNTGHRRQVEENKINMMNRCYRFFSGFNCPPELITAMEVVVEKAR